MTLKLYTIWHTNCYAVYWYFMNIIFYLYKLLVVLIYYWSLWITSIKLMSHCKVIFTMTECETWQTEVCNSIKYNRGPVKGSSCQTEHSLQIFVSAWKSIDCYKQNFYNINNANSTIPLYSGKQIVIGEVRIFSTNKSFLLRKRIMDVSVNHLLLQIESNNCMLSCIRFWKHHPYTYKPEKSSNLFSTTEVHTQNH